MKKFFRRVNRGLLLAAILVIALLIYLGVDQAIFNSEKSEISTVVQNYVEAVNEFSVSQHLKEDPDGAARQLEEILEESFCNKGGTGTRSSNSTRGSILREFLLMADEDAQGYVTESNYNISELKVSKNGPGAALVQFSITYNLKVMEQKDTPFWAVFPWGTQFIHSEIYEDVQAEEDQTLREASVSVPRSVSFELFYRDGEWRISNIGGAYSGYSEMIYDYEQY